jgi:hypothetical protein
MDSSELRIRHETKWLATGLAIMVGTALLCGVLIVADDRAMSDDRMQQALAVFAAFMILAAVEFPFREYVFTSSRARAWYWFRWHETELPRTVAVSVLDGGVALADPQTGGVLLRVTREFTRSGKLAEQLASFYRAHGKLAGG